MATTTGSIVNTPGALESAARTDAPSKEQIQQLAEQFESMLLAQMLRGMRESMAPDDTEGLGAPIMNDTFNMELGSALSRTGGFGLADFLGQALSRLDEQAGSHVSTALDSLPHAMPFSVDDAVSIPLTDATPVASKVVTSDFGWRQDPINGTRTFHAGQDLRAAYGGEVRAASGGTVVSADEKPGYGLMVVVDHGGGLETRYAHLSAVDVTPGMTVEPGQLIARSGASGRVTGPHLHFEVRKDGQPIDPERVTGFVQVADGGH